MRINVLLFSEFPTNCMEPSRTAIVHNLTGTLLLPVLPRTQERLAVGFGFVKVQRDSEEEGYGH